MAEWSAVPRSEAKKQSKTAKFKNMRVALTELLSMAAEAEAADEVWMRVKRGVVPGSMEQAKVDFARRHLASVSGGGGVFRK